MDPSEPSKVKYLPHTQFHVAGLKACVGLWGEPGGSLSRPGVLPRLCPEDILHPQDPHCPLPFFQSPDPTQRPRACHAKLLLTCDKPLESQKGTL